MYIYLLVESHDQYQLKGKIWQKVRTIIFADHLRVSRWCYCLGRTWNRSTAVSFSPFTIIVLPNPELSDGFSLMTTWTSMQHIFPCPISSVHTIPPWWRRESKQVNYQSPVRLDKHAPCRTCSSTLSWKASRPLWTMADNDNNEVWGFLSVPDKLSNWRHLVVSTVHCHLSAPITQLCHPSTTRRTRPVLVLP